MRKDLTFTALDFETANWYRRSACSIGMVKVEEGVVVDEFYSLIKLTQCTWNLKIREPTLSGLLL